MRNLRRWWTRRGRTKITMMTRTFLVHVAVLGTFGMTRATQTSRQQHVKNYHVNPTELEKNGRRDSNIASTLRQNRYVDTKA